MTQPATTASQTCRECGKVFSEATQKLRTVRDYNLTAEGAICRNRPECRGRVISAVYEERGLKRWGRETQEQHLLVMDVPPKGWDRSKPWVSVNFAHDRVLAAIKFYSTCWPVCLLYAVQTDADGEPIPEYGEWKRHTHRSLATVLHMSQSEVTRAIKYLKLRNLVIELDDRLYTELGPKLLTLKERDSCTRANPLESISEFSALPTKALKKLAEVRSLVSDDVRTELDKVAEDACTRLNRAISEARTQASKTVLDACNARVTLLSRLGDLENKRAGVASIATPLGPPAKNRPVDEDGQTPVKEVYSPPALDASDLELLAEADEHDRPELEAEMLADAAEFRRQDQAEAKILAQFDRETERMRKRGEVAIPQAPAVAGPTPIQVLYRSLPELQAQYPNARFATPRWSVLGKADCQLAHRILDALEGDSWDREHRKITASDVTEFLVYVEKLLATTRSPMTSAGPKKLGLLIHWAEDWAREAPERRRQEADYRAMQAADQAHQESLQRQQELDLEIDRRMEEIWAAMPDPEKHRRLTATLAELQADTRVKWKQFTKDQQRAHMETYAKRVLRREISEAPEIAQGAGGE